DPGAVEVFLCVDQRARQILELLITTRHQLLAVGLETALVLSALSKQSAVDLLFDVGACLVPGDLLSQVPWALGEGCSVDSQYDDHRFQGGHRLSGFFPTNS